MENIRRESHVKLKVVKSESCLNYSFALTNLSKLEMMLGWLW